ncbi:cytochrome c maturation protein CcmE [Candidatus Chlorohelix sp.]|uniref:cytochrome c maturation protein CcmE n=1 Tax=Candidatus Chlorohelix sp. TaxID=3139201 RepID=UPI003073BC08
MARATLSTAPVKSISTGFEQHRKSPLKSKLKFYLVGVVILGAAAFVAFSAMQGATVYYYDVHEVKAKLVSGTLANESFRMAGQVVPGTIRKGDTADTYIFTVSDMKQKDLTITATYKGVIPDTFKDQAQVTLTGNFNSSQSMFVATELLAKCPSKYSTAAE